MTIAVDLGRKATKQQQHNTSRMGLILRNLILLLANKKGTDQPGHLSSLISAFVICSLQSIMPPLSTSIHAKFQYSITVSVAG